MTTHRMPVSDTTEKIAAYLTAFTSPEDPVLTELYRETHAKVLYPRMASGHLQGKLLEFFSRMIRPEAILEIGTYTGYSAICLAKGLTPGGKLHTIEINDELQSIIEKYILKAGLQDRIELHIGDARTLVPELTIMFDLAFIDADKEQYLAYYEALLPKLKPGGFVLADNVLWSGKVTQPSSDKETRGIIAFNERIKNDPRVDHLMIPLRDGMMLIRKKEHDGR